MKQLYLLILLLVTSLASFAQAKEENLKIVWPEEYKWKIGSNQEDKSTHFMELIPGKEDIEHWTMLGTMMSLKGVKVSSTDQVVKMYTESSLKESPDAKLTVLEKNEKAKNIWVLFKVETPKFPNDPNPESQLYYAVQGESALYINFISVRQKSLSNDFVVRWSKVFRESELVYQ